MSISTTSKGYSGLLNKAGRQLMNTTAMTAAGLLVLGGNAKAANDWTGHILDSGSTTVDTSVLNETNITQHSSVVKARGDADIKLGHTVNLAQPSTSSRYILFDTEADPTQIHGSLNANGEVYIFDRNGVIFGANAQVDVGSLVASSGTLTSTDAELDAGKIKIDLADTDGDVINRGHITVAQGGLAAFVAPNVLNSGVINAKLGTVAIAAGQHVTLDMYGDGLFEVAVDGDLGDGLLKNIGEIKARGGNVAVSAAIAKDAVEDVINMAGVTRVSSAQVKGGKIILSGGDSGRVNVRGTLQASGGSGQDAGSIDVTGERVRVADTARLRANAGDENAAGEINVIADKTLILDGRITAQGMVGTGDVETSAPIALFGAGASVLATREWLLDPTDLEIDAALASLLSAQLNVGDMTVQTNGAGADAGNITLLSGASVTKTAGADTTFTMKAHNDISILGTIIGSGTGALNVDLNADFDVSGGDADVFVHNDIQTNGGTFSATASDDIDIRSGAVVNTAGGNVDIASRGLGNGSWLWMPAGGNAGGILTSGGDVNIAVNNMNLASGSFISAGTGNVTINRDVDGTIGLGAAAGDMELTQDEIARIDAATLVVGGAKTTALDVDGVDTTSSTITGLVTLNALAAGGDVTVNGANVFDSLTVNADDDILVDGGSSITTKTGGVSLTANNNVNDSNAVLQVEGLIDTRLAGVDGDIDLAAANYFVEIDPTGSILTDGGALNVTSNHGFDIDNDAVVDLGAGDAHIDAPLVQLGDDIVTTGSITGTASTVKVENDNAQIQDGVDVAADNASVYVAAGTYNESVNLYKAGLQLLGANTGISAVDGTRVAETIVQPNSPGFNVTADDVTIDGFTVDGSLTAGDNGIHVDGVNNFTAINNIVKNNTDTNAGRAASGYTTGIGIFVKDSTGSIDISENAIHDNVDGVRILDTDAVVLGNVVVSDNDITDNSDKGIIINRSDRAKVADNTLDGNGTGIWLEGSSNGLVSGNDILNSIQNGIRLRNNSDSNELNDNTIDGAGINGILATAGSDIVKVLGNIIKNITGDAVQLDGSANALVDDNNIDVATNGVRIIGGSDATVSNNEIDDVSEAAIHVSDNDDAQIKLNEVNDNGASTFAKYGILVEGGNSVDVDDNKIEETSVAGISAVDTTYIDIDDNLVKDGKDGILVDGGHHADIRRNETRDMSDDGIQVLSHNDVEIEDNNKVIRSGDSGITVSGSLRAEIDGNNVDVAKNGIRLTDSDDSTISNNEVDDASNAAIFALRSDDAQIKLNEVNDNGASTFAKYGILVEGGNSVDVDDNKIEETSVAGISAVDTTYIDIDDNLVKDGKDGILVDGGHHADIRRNETRDMSDEGIEVIGHNNVDVETNTVLRSDDDGIRVVGGRNGYIYDNTVTDTGDDAIRVKGNRNVEIASNDIDDAGDEGIHVSNSGGRNVFIHDNEIDDVEDNGIEVNGGYDVAVYRNDVDEADGNGIFVEDSNEAYVSWNIIDDSGENGIYLSGSHDSDILGNEIDDSDEHGIKVNPSNFVDIAHNEIDDSGYDGINVQSGFAADIWDNEITDSGYDGIDVTGNNYVDIWDNDIDGAGDNGIEVASSDNAEIYDNDITDVDTDGINVDESDNAEIYGNLIYGQATASVFSRRSRSVMGAGRDGIHVEDSASVIIDDNTVQGDSANFRKDGLGAGRHGIYVEGGNGFFFGDGVQVTNNHILGDLGFIHSSDSVGSDGIHIEDNGFGFFGSRPVVSGNYVEKTGNDGIDVEGTHFADIFDNEVRFAGDDGIEVEDSAFVDIRGNDVYYSGDDGIDVERSRFVDINGNHIHGAEDDGIEVSDSFDADVIANRVHYVGGDGIYARGVFGADIRFNNIHDADRDGIDVEDSNFVDVNFNRVRSVGDNGIEVQNSDFADIFGNRVSRAGENGIYVNPSDFVDIGFNQVFFSRQNGIDVNGGHNIDIFRNLVGFNGRDGINVDGSRHVDISNNVSFANRGDGIDVNANHYGLHTSPNEINITDNITNRNGDNGIEVSGDSRVNGIELLIDGNTANDNGDNGIQILADAEFFGPKMVQNISRVVLIPNEFNSVISNNIVENNTNNGLHVAGGGHDNVAVSGNSFTENEIGALFESGTIDLTGDRNFFNGGDVGMRFAPAIIGYDSPATFTRSLALGDPIFADMSLVGNTIGAQTFNGQSGHYVELDNGAFFAPGNPTLLNALDSTYVGTPFGTVTPSVDFAGGFTLAQLAYFESKFQHFNDNGNTGLFFFPLLPEIAQEDIFNYFGPNAAALSGLNITILGLPGIPGGAPVALNNIAPAAGGTDPASLNAIATASGGDSEGSSSTCWGDALNVAGTGQSSTISYGGSAEDLLNSEASCGS